MADKKHFVVIGLGSFGTALARRLCENHCRVTGVDANQEHVEDLKDILYEAVIGDATERESLANLRIDTADAIFISLGEDITRSLLATLHCRELGAQRVIVKGVTPEHGKILRSLGVERVIFPEIEIAQQLAERTAWTSVVDVFPIDDEHSFLELAVPDSLVGRTLQEANLRRNVGVWVVGVKDVISGKMNMFPNADYTFGPDQLLLVVGKQDALNRLRDLT